MRIRALTLLFIGAITAFGQAKKDASTTTDKVDQAAAYYHYAVARMYAEMADASGGRNRDYVNKAIENYKAAIKADPQSSLLNEELARVTASGRLRVPPALWRPAERPNR